MELLEGEDLEARLSRHRRLAPRVIASLLSQAAQGLDAAHAAGVVHRDLKPANVFLARGASGDVVKLLDFGVAAWRAAAEGGAVEEADVDPSGAGEYFAGTVAYLSPEQAWDHQPADPRSDLWSLAVVVYRALTGALPFPAHSLGELVVKIHGERPVPPSAIVPELGRAADAFFERALARDPPTDSLRRPPWRRRSPSWWRQARYRPAPRSS